MKNGVPYDVAFSYSDAERFAACVVMSEHDGAIYDWNAMEFKDRKAMREFRDMGVFADHLARLAAKSTAVTHHLTEETAKDVEKVAKAEIGHYQPAVGPFAKWEQLKPETEAEKKRLGFRLNAPWNGLARCVTASSTARSGTRRP